MKIEIDQSGKIEDTAKKTIVADSLGNAVYISAQNKRDALKLFRQQSNPRMFIIKLFALCCAHLIVKTFSPSKNKASLTYIIDVEYDRLDNDIKAYIQRFLISFNHDIPSNQIRFSRVGKSSKSHKYAYQYAKDSKQRRLLQEITLDEIKRIL